MSYPPFDPAPIPGAIRQIGSSPRNRTVTALCLDAKMQLYILTARDLGTIKMSDPLMLLTGADLLEAIPIATAASFVRRDCLEATDVALGKDDAVYRAKADGMRIQGVLAAFHGLAILRVGEKRVRASGLLEVRFDARGPSGELPSLEPNDLGCLVSLASGEACAVLVAGAGRVGYAVPLREALARLELMLAALPEVVSDVETGLALGLDAMRSEISRDAELDLGEPPIGLAA